MYIKSADNVLINYTMFIYIYAASISLDIYLICFLIGFLLKTTLYYIICVIFDILYPIGSMYGIFTYIYHTFMPHVGKYAIHGSY